MKIDWPAYITELRTVDSTNTFVKQTLSTSREQELPWLVIAHEQTAGRGRNSKSWLSDRHSLTFSVAYEHETAGDDVSCDASKLPLAIGMAVAAAIQPFVTARVQVKWPNDVFLDGKKVAGILIESVRDATTTLNGRSSQLFVIGIGINCNVDLSSLDSTVARRSTSIASHLEPDLSYSDELKWDILNRVCNAIRTTFSKLADVLRQLHDEWPRVCFLKGRWVEVSASQHNVAGECLGIDERGALIVRDPAGHWHTILSGEILQY